MKKNYDILNGSYIFIKKDVKSHERVYFHFNSRMQTLIELLKNEYSKARIFYTVHYFEWKTLPNHEFAGFKKIEETYLGDKYFMYLIEKDKLFMNICDFIIVLSKDTYNIVTQFYFVESEKVIYMPNSVFDIYNINISTHKEEIKKELGFDKNVKLLLFVGRLVPNKGIVELIDAFKYILSYEQNCKLLLVGDGCYDRCMEKIKPFYNKLCFTGFIEKELVIKLYHIADIGIVPSYFEEWGFVALEMMAAKLPLIITNSPGLSELSDKNDILMAKCRDSQSLATQILKLIKNTSLQEECSAKSRLKYEQKYSMQVFKKKILSVYKLSEQML